jgi:hypothetical protein
MNNKEIDRKLKTNRVETCLNCVLFTNCEKIGMLDDCEDGFEVDSDKVVVIISLEEHNMLRSKNSARNINM